ncbi:hypothetical protein [Spongiactinospora sp. TRM90649]|uniref:hypothetical protein n=1 Tax=Spongiactinospora sp. TRM90649 TaxID=3031114 RepID=UPI0023F68DA5|nr:hypothetical protein [Spongiactinospora sp. TRM90649]MDF5754690.1 hypothetical protein [Spongiactinospora sp. TRM90649]
MPQIAGDRRKLVFVALVAVLAVVGIYLTMGPSPDDSPDDTRESGVSGDDRPVAAPTPRPPLATASNAPFDIYSYLPMSKEELAATADVARRFVAAYGTFRFDEEQDAYADRLKNFTTTELGSYLARGVAAPGMIEQNVAEQRISESTATVKSIRQVDQNSVIFVVTANRRVTVRNVPSQSSEDFAVTLVPVGGDWRVHDVQPATDGQEGDPASVPEGVR